jgi:hypothetical protein
MPALDPAHRGQGSVQPVTEIKKMPNRGHSLTIDHGWQEVAQTALDFVKRFDPAKPSWARQVDAPDDCLPEVGKVALVTQVQLIVDGRGSVRLVPLAARRRAELSGRMVL